MKQNRSLKFRNFKIAVLCLYTWYSLILTSNAQWTTDTKKDFQESKQDIMNTIQTPVTDVPIMEGPVDPVKYYIGPSDIISVNIWISPPLNMTLTVTPEGTLIIPTVGEIRIIDMTLADAKKKIILEIKKKYLSGDPTVTLLSPRKIAVKVTGTVRYPGKYFLTASDRVDNAILLANKKLKDAAPEEIILGKEIRDDEKSAFEERYQTKRNIRLIHRTGETIRVDILQYYATRNEQCNPFLREGDEVLVSRYDPKKNIFAVYGGVNVQGAFEFIEGDNFLNAFDLSYGFTLRAMKDSIVLYRFNTQTGDQILSIHNYDEIKNNTQKNFILLPGDRIVVKEKPDIRENYHVFVDGEVNHPGLYPITKENTKLSKVIEWAGGFTEFASLNGANVSRTPMSFADQQFERIISMRGSGIPEDTNYYSIENQLKSNREMASVDFRELFEKRDTTQDIILKNGDWVHIPSIQKTIYVYGQVRIPGNVPFIEGNSYKDYILRAGGYTDDARNGDVMIIKRATRQWLSTSETKIEDGDYIWVPKEPIRPATYYWSIIGQTASIISVAVTTILLIIQLKK